jgi:hypothetical protein
MYYVDKNGQAEPEEINLLPSHEVRKFGIDTSDFALLGVLSLPLLIVAFAIG